MNCPCELRSNTKTLCNSWNKKTSFVLWRSLLLYLNRWFVLIVAFLQQNTHPVWSENLKEAMNELKKFIPRNIIKYEQPENMRFWQSGVFSKRKPEWADTFQILGWIWLWIQFSAKMNRRRQRYYKKDIETYYHLGLHFDKSVRGAPFLIHVWSLSTCHALYGHDKGSANFDVTFFMVFAS